MKKFFAIAAVIVGIVVLLNSFGLFENNDSIPVDVNTEVCRVCEGSKICHLCDGDGVLELSEPLGGPRKCAACTANPGVCRTCKGAGYMIIDG